MTCISGDETGLVKIWNIKHSSAATVSFSYGAQGRSRGVHALCWVDRTTSDVLVSMADNTISRLNVRDKMMVTAVKREGLIANNAYGMQVVRDKLVVVAKDGRIALTTWDDSSDHVGEKVQYLSPIAPVDSCQINRRYGLVATGGKDNNLKIWRTHGERHDEPLFEAMNVRDHVLDVPYPIHIVGTCVVDPHVFGVATAFHDVRFYDMRVSQRPVQEFRIDREISRRPTALQQWNCNKFLVSEASGDIHLYDTRRGFASRAKLRGGVGSVRQMVKHAGGQQVLAAIGLDRKVRIYHVPTGKLLSSIYVKQKGTAVLLDNQMPFIDNTEAFSNVANAKKGVQGLGEKAWSEMEPVCDFEDDEPVQPR
jgi:ribosome biogenesis protein NSA1